MFRRIIALVACFLCIQVLAACGASQSATPTSVAPTSAATQPVGESTVTSTSSNPASNYPKLGHAPDYSWIAGWVSVTRIQGGCIYIRTDAPPATPGPSPTPGISGPIVGTAVKGDTSPPLRDITPVAPSVPTPDVSSGVFIPGGDGWDPSRWQNGDYVVAFGHVAGPGEPREMCPGGAQYIIDRVQANP